MPNYCEYVMRVKGEPRNVDRFVNLMKADYDEPKHFWRIFDAEVFDEECIDRMKIVDISGDCAWSVHSCMRDGFGTYADENPKSSTTLEEQSELLQLAIEVYGSEPGVGFQEHYLYKNGEEIINDCEDYSEMYFEDEADFESMKEQRYCDGLSWDEVDEDGYIKTGGIEDWGIFEI